MGSTLCYLAKGALLTGFSDYYHQIIFGIALISLVQFFRKGIFGLVSKKLVKRGRRQE
jgi:ABC-type branched-subunit amino acid transport system permease subunit